MIITGRYTTSGGVLVGIAVVVAVGVFVTVPVGVLDGVFVGVLVTVLVEVFVGVFVVVPVGVFVGVLVTVLVAVLVGVFVGVSVTAKASLASNSGCSACAEPSKNVAMTIAIVMAMDVGKARRIDIFVPYIGKSAS